MKKKLLFIIMISIAVCFAVSCDLFQKDNDSDDGLTENELASELNKLLLPEGLTTDSTNSEFSEVLISEETPEENYSKQDGIPVKTVITVKQYNASAKYNTQVLLNPSTDVIYPGSVLIGSSISDGSYREVVQGEKNEITVSYGGFSQVRDDDGEQGVISGTIYPTLSNYRILHNNIMSQQISGVNSSYTLNETNVSTESAFEARFKAGVSYSGLIVKASVKGNFDYSSENSMNKYMISFAQTYYTADVDQGENTFLYKDFNIEDFEGVRPVYVSSIAYGRLAFITLESKFSLTEVSAGLEAALSTPSLLVNAEASGSVKKFKESSNLNITVIGANTVVNTLDGFREFLVNGGFSDLSNGQIISYKLRFVDDNSVANTIYNGSYTIRNVQQIYGSYSVQAQADGLMYNAWDSGSPNVDLVGRIELKSPDGSIIATLWQTTDAVLGWYPTQATVYYDLTEDTINDMPTVKYSFTAASLMDNYSLFVPDNAIYNNQGDGNNVYFSEGTTNFTLQDALDSSDGLNHVELISYSKSQTADYTKFRVRFWVTEVYPE